MGHYTKQHCKICGKTMEIDAGNFLMNLNDLDRICVCDKCKKLKKNIKKGELKNGTDD